MKLTYFLPHITSIYFMIKLFTKSTTIVLPLFFYFLFIGNAMAQTDSTQLATSARKQEAVLQRLAYDLKLTDGQQQEVKHLLITRSSRLRDAKSNRSVDIQQKSEAQLATILTAEQMDLYLSLRSELKARREKECSKNGKQSFVDPELDF